MRKIFLLIVLVLTLNIIHAQNAYYDALKLSQNFERNNFEKKSVVVLSNYFGYVFTDFENNQDELVSKLNKDFKTNPFFKNYIINPGTKASLSDFSLANIPSLTGLDVTNYANILSNIMIDHAKQELTVAFFSKFKKFADKNSEFHVMFPKTTGNLENLLDYKYTEMLPTLRNGFYEDLNQLAYHLDDVLELPKYRELLKNFPEVRVAIRSINLVHNIESGASNAAEVIKEFSDFKEWDDPTATIDFKNMGSTIKLAALFSESLRDTSISDTIKQSLWISPEQAKKMIKNETFFNIYMGLIYQKTKGIKFYSIKENVADSITFSKIMEDNVNNLILFQNKVDEFIVLANDVDNVFKSLKGKKSKNEKLVNSDYYNYINVSIDLVDYSFSIAQIFNEDLDVTSYMAIAKLSNNLYKDIYNKQYAQAVMDGTDILLKVQELINKNTLETNGSRLLKTSGVDIPESVKKLAEGKSCYINDNDLIAAKNAIKEWKNVKDTNDWHKLIVYYQSREKLDELVKFIEKVRPFALFMANIVNAKNPDEIQMAIENAILPAGSSAIKKNSSFNISVQSYLGGFYSLNNANTGNTSWNDTYGIHGPIGISFNFGLKEWGSISAFGSLFDLGAIIDYKLTSDSVTTAGGQNTLEVKKESQIKLGQIISPGLYAVYGFPFNWPLSLGIGTQFGPGLSKIESDSNTVVNNPTWRPCIFVNVDIPLMTLKNTPKKKYK